MANWGDQPQNQSMAYARNAEMDDGLRAYMLGIYNYMSLGVLLTGIMAYAFSQSSYFEPVMYSPMRWLVMLAPLGFAMSLSFGINRMQASTAQMVFWAYAAVNGLALSVIFRIYTNTSIVETFLATSAAFAGLSLVGYTTKRDLTGMGRFLTMALFGLMAAMLLNIFFPMGAGGNLLIDIVGVLIFAGLTAYDTQKLKSFYAYNVEYGDEESAAKTRVMGALTLYLDFINMFLFLLRMMGDRR